MWSLSVHGWLRDKVPSGRKASVYVPPNLLAAIDSLPGSDFAVLGWSGPRSRLQLSLAALRTRSTLPLEANSPAVSWGGRSLRYNPRRD
jgi:hypothetical protein